MCGILFQLSKQDSDIVYDTTALEEKVANRGPDSCETIIRHTPDWRLTFTASVLHLRGSQVYVQPIEGERGDVLCWNGEVWDGLDVSVTSNDTEALFRALQECPNSTCQVLGKLRGPFAFVYYQATECKLWYGRDVLGRRSLLRRKVDDGLVLASVADRTQHGWQVVETDGIYCLDLTSRNESIHAWADEPSSNELQRPYGHVSQYVSQHDECNRQEMSYTQSVSSLHAHLLKAVQVRALTIPPTDDNRFSRIAVMYSGGVDCAVIARLLHDVVDAAEPIDLLNVSFENPRTIANAKKQGLSSHSIYDTPDRVTGRQGHMELAKACPRPWRFIEINVTHAEAQQARNEVLDLMYPNDSVMDFSIALAFYFCARGIGEVDGVLYQSAAKVYFSGLGADEQLGGYSRHAAAFQNGSYTQLNTELQMDLDRIPTRNLGRDDRVISHFGREVRWPFLDEEVISFLCSLPLDHKMSFKFAGGDKIILRELGRRLDIPLASGEKKRAIQFGSRSARMEVEVPGQQKVKGHLQVV